MDINDKQFFLGASGKILKYLDNRFSSIFNSLEGVKNGVVSLSGLSKNTFNVEVKNPIEVKNQKDYSNYIQALDKKLGDLKAILFSIERKEPILVENKQVDFTDLSNKLTEIKSAINKISIPEADFTDVILGLDKVKKEISSIKFPQFPKIPESQKVVIPDKFSFKEAKDLDSRLKDLIVAVKKIKQTDVKVDISGVEKAVEKLGKKLDNIKTPEFNFPDIVNTHSTDPVFKPTPVTNININPLRGIVHTTATTVSTTLTAIPGYGVLENRRSIIFYNNDNNNIVYIGGSGVTTSNGIPIEPKSFSPSFDSGPTQVWYGRTTSGTVSVRSVELQNSSGG